jgi:hypothetical protein
VGGSAGFIVPFGGLYPHRGVFFFYIFIFVVWRKEELAKIDGSEDADDETKIQRRLALLKQQSIHLATIDTMRGIRNQERRQLRIAEFFRATGAPHQWLEQTYKQVNTMDTAEKQRARELSEIYHVRSFHHPSPLSLDFSP